MKEPGVDFFRISASFLTLIAPNARRINWSWEEVLSPKQGAVYATLTPNVVVLVEIDRAHL